MVGDAAAEESRSAGEDERLLEGGAGGGDELVGAPDEGDGVEGAFGGEEVLDEGFYGNVVGLVGSISLGSQSLVGCLELRVGGRGGLAAGAVGA